MSNFLLITQTFWFEKPVVTSGDGYCGLKVQQTLEAERLKYNSWKIQWNQTHFCCFTKEVSDWLFLNTARATVTWFYAAQLKTLQLTSAPSCCSILQSLEKLHVYLRKIIFLLFCRCMFHTHTHTPHTFARTSLLLQMQDLHSKKLELDTCK